MKRSKFLTALFGVPFTLGACHEITNNNDDFKISENGYSMRVTGSSSVDPFRAFTIEKDSGAPVVYIWASSTMEEFLISTSENYSMRLQTQLLQNIDLRGGTVIVPRRSSSQISSSISPENGSIIYNTSTDKFQGYANGSWVNLH